MLLIRFIFLKFLTVFFYLITPNLEKQFGVSFIFTCRKSGLHCTDYGILKNKKYVKVKKDVNAEFSVKVKN